MSLSLLLFGLRGELINSRRYGLRVTLRDLRPSVVVVVVVVFVYVGVCFVVCVNLHSAPPHVTYFYRSRLFQLIRGTLECSAARAKNKHAKREKTRS